MRFSEGGAVKNKSTPASARVTHAQAHARTQTRTQSLQHPCAQRPRAFTQSPERGRMARGAPAQTGGLGTEFEATRALCACTQSPQPCVDGRPHDVQTELATCPRPRTHVLREHDAMKGQPPAAGACGRRRRQVPGRGTRAAATGSSAPARCDSTAHTDSGDGALELRPPPAAAAAAPQSLAEAEGGGGLRPRDSRRAGP